MGYKTWFDSTWMREGIPFIQNLLDAGLEVNALNKYGMTMLSHAAECGYLQIAEFLLEKGADANVANSDGSKPLHIAAQYGRKEIVKFFLNRGMSVDTPLMDAAVNARSSVFMYLIDCGADVKACDKKGETVLHYACRGGRLDIVKSLMSKGWDLDAKTDCVVSPLLIAAENSHLSVVEYLIECGLDVKCWDEDGWTLLHHACREEWLDIVKCLTKKGCDVNARNVDQDTPLHIAVGDSSWGPGDIEIIKHLLSKDADCNAINAEGKTAFGLFLESSCCLEGITLFLGSGAYFQLDEYATIGNDSYLKEGILQNTQLCTMAFINKFNNSDLRKMYEIPVVSGMLPLQIDELKIASQSITRDIAESVEYEIQNQGYCNVLNISPILLRRLCVLALVKHYNS